jgi:hypothetical protein
MGATSDKTDIFGADHIACVIIIVGHILVEPNSIKPPIYIYMSQTCH